MDELAKISIEEISKHDIYMIIKALEYTGSNTNISSFLELKDAILKQLALLYDTSEEEFINYLENSFRS
ncbi:MAG: hypothetical protein GX214_02285 [Clostridiales bacterium]|nr:hypothetical protein [Clostridiales bacterium]